MCPSAFLIEIAGTSPAMTKRQRRVALLHRHLRGPANSNHNIFLVFVFQSKGALQCIGRYGA
jgi:hypothetical protein